MTNSGGYPSLSNEYIGWNNCVGWQFFDLTAELFPTFSKLSKYKGKKLDEISICRLEFFQKRIRLAAELFNRLIRSILGKFFRSFLGIIDGKKISFLRSSDLYSPSHLTSTLSKKMFRELKHCKLEFCMLCHKRTWKMKRLSSMT